MPITLPVRYKSPYAFPDVLTPPDSAVPGFDTDAVQAQNLDDASPDQPNLQRIPRPPKTGTDAMASQVALPPLRPQPSTGPVRKFKAPSMPPPEEAKLEPPPSPIAAPGAAAPTPNPEEAGIAPVPTPSSLGPKPQTAVEKASSALEAQHAKRPEMPQSNWAQRLGLAILSLTKFAPIANQIMHPKWAGQEAAYEQTLGDLQEQEKEAVEAERGEAYSAQKQAQAESYKLTAEQRAAATAERSQAAKQKITDSLIKAGYVQLNPGQATPQGWATATDPSNPSAVWVRRSPIINLPNSPDILTKFPGAKAGDPVAAPEYDSALKALWQDQLESKKENAKPVKGPTNEVELAQAAQNPDPSVSGPAKAALKTLLDQKAAGRPNVNITYTPKQQADFQQAIENPPPPGQRNEDFLKTLTPNEQLQVKALTDYDTVLPSGFAMAKPFWQDLFAKAKAYDPTFDSKEYGSRQSALKDFTSGKTAQNARSLRTLVGHLGTLYDAGKALNNNDMPAANHVLNWLSQQTGDPRMTDFNYAKNAVATELSTALKGQATEGDIRTWQDTISRSASPAQLLSGLREPMALMHRRLAEIRSQFSDAFGPNNIRHHLLSPEARQGFQSLGLDPDRIDPPAAAAPVGGVPKEGQMFNGRKVLKVVKIQ